MISLSRVDSDVWELSTNGLKNILHDFGNFNIAANKTLLLTGADVESCFAIEIAMANRENPTSKYVDLFQKAVQPDTDRPTTDRVKFGTLGVIAGAVSPEDRKFGIVASEPIHISLNEDIIFRVNLTDLFKKIILGTLPNPVVIQPDQKLLLEDIQIDVLHHSNGSLCRQTFAAYMAAANVAFTRAISDLKASRLLYDTVITARRPLISCPDPKLKKVPQGLIWWSEQGFTLGVESRPFSSLLMHGQ
jgi:hypothetical protein